MSHVGRTSSVISSDISPTSMSNVGYQHLCSVIHTYTNLVDFASHFMGTTLVTAIHIGKISPTFASHVRDMQPITTSHDGVKQLFSASTLGGKFTPFK